MFVDYFLPKHRQKESGWLRFNIDLKRMVEQGCLTGSAIWRKEEGRRIRGAIWEKATLARIANCSVRPMRTATVDVIFSTGVPVCDCNHLNQRQLTIRRKFETTAHRLQTNRLISN